MSGITLHKSCPLSPITKDELMSYIFYAESRIQIAVNDNSLYLDDEWEGTEEQITMVENHRLWPDFLAIWEYAELGKLPLAAGVRLNAEIANEFLVDIYKFIGMGEVLLAHDGSFGFETLDQREAGAKVAYKFLARAKLDYKINLDDMPIGWLFPVAADEALTTTEYALLAGLRHVGAVRNEVSDKHNPLMTKKVGNTLLISIDEARKKLPLKRKFVPSIGIDYDLVG